MSTTWRTIALVSLAANLLIAGVGIGAYAAGARFQPPGQSEPARSGPERPMRAFLSALPPERRAETRREMARTLAEARDLRKEAREARVALARAAEAEPYDATAVKAAFARMRTADGAIAARFQDAVADRLATLSPEERRAVLRQLLSRRSERADAGMGAGMGAGMAAGGAGMGAARAAAESGEPVAPAGPAARQRQDGEPSLREERIRRFLERRRGEEQQPPPEATP